MMVGSSSGSFCKTTSEGRGCSTSVDGATEGEAVAELEEGNKKSSCDGDVGWEEKGNKDSSKTTCREIITRRVDKSKQR
jgi:hypothetical protein